MNEISKPFLEFKICQWGEVNGIDGYIITDRKLLVPLNCINAVCDNDRLKRSIYTCTIYVGNNEFVVEGSSAELKEVIKKSKHRFSGP